MTLETYLHPGDLYLARGGEVNVNRPFFTGDVLGGVAIPGVQEAEKAIIIAHPCSMRGKGARLQDKVLVAAVGEYGGTFRPNTWQTGYYAVMPLPDLLGDGSLYVGRFEDVGTALSREITKNRRLACLSPFGINLLQQRLVWNLTRLEVPTFVFHQAFDHTIEEAELLEEWVDTLLPSLGSEETANSLFGEFLRRDRASGRTFQDDLRDPQRRSAVRVACKSEAGRLIQEGQAAL